MVDEKNEKDEKHENHEHEEHDDEFYEDIAQAADFIHDRLDDMVEPSAFNNTVEEYIEDEGNEEKGMEEKGTVPKS